MDDVISSLAHSPEPSIAYKVRVGLLHEDPGAPELRRLRDAIRHSSRVKALLSERRSDSTIPHHPYRKWYGAHWVLVALADLDYPPGDLDLVPLRDQVLDGKYYRLGDVPENGRSLVDWGGTSTKQMNPWATVEALSVLERARGNQD